MLISHRIAARYSWDIVIENLKIHLDYESPIHVDSFTFCSVSVSWCEMVQLKILYKLDILTFRDLELGEKCENKCEIEQFDCISKCETSNTACLSDCSRENIICYNCKLLLVLVYKSVKLFLCSKIYFKACPCNEGCPEGCQNCDHRLCQSLLILSTWNKSWEVEVITFL